MLTKYKMDLKYKKIIAAFLGVCLVLGISASAWADNGTQSGASSAPTQQNGGAPGRMGRPNGGNNGMNGGFGGGQPGDMPETSDSERPDDMPEMPDGERPDDMPEMPDGEQPGDMPEMPDGEPPMNGMPGDMPGMAWGKLVDDGVISQETCDAIEEYIKENAPDKPDDDTAAGDSERPEPPEKPADDDGTEPPEKPEGDGSEPPEKPDDGELTDGIPGLTEELLDALLDAGIITEDEYEALLELVPAGDVSKA